MEITIKKLVEQAWSLKVNLERRILINTPFYLGGFKANLSTDTKQKLHRVHRRAYSRYLRRLEKLWH